MKLQVNRAPNIRLGIVRTAADFFHRQGLQSTTIDEIIEAAGVTKAEFHQHFKNKAELASAVLRHYFEGLAAGVGPVKYELDSWDDLQECLQSHLEFQKSFKMGRSCPIGKLGSELKEGDDPTRQALCLIVEMMLARLESFFSREKIAGRLSSTADVEQLANFCIATIQGAMLTGKIRRNCDSVETVFEDLLSHLRLYAKAPAAARQGLGGKRHPNGRSMVAKRPEHPPALRSPDSSAPGLHDGNAKLGKSPRGGCLFEEFISKKRKVESALEVVGHLFKEFTSKKKKVELALGAQSESLNSLRNLM